MAYSALILGFCVLASLGILAYSRIFYRRGKAMGSTGMLPALQRMVEDGKDEVLPAVRDLRHRFEVVSLISLITGLAGAGLSVAALVTDTVAAAALALLGLAVLLIAGAGGLMIVRPLLLMIESDLSETDLS
ncbi:MAG: hypothetical protein ACYC3G_04695 [Minisyncoccota bacterium]